MAGLKHVDDNFSARAVAVDFDPSGFDFEHGGRKSPIRRGSVDKTVFAQRRKADTEPVLLLVIGFAFFARGVVKIRSTVINAHTIRQKQRLSGGRDHAAVPGTGVERDQRRIGKSLPALAVGAGGEKHFDRTLMRAVFELMVDIEKPQQTEITVAVIEAAEPVEISPAKTSLLREATFVIARNPNRLRIAPVNEIVALGKADASSRPVFTIALVGFHVSDIFPRARIFEKRRNIAEPSLAIVLGRKFKQRQHRILSSRFKVNTVFGKRHAIPAIGETE